MKMILARNQRCQGLLSKQQWPVARPHVSLIITLTTPLQHL